MKIERRADIQDLSRDLLLATTDVASDEWTRKLRALSKAVTIAENSYSAASELLLSARKTNHKSAVVGITGLPGSGKSTLINSLIKSLRAMKKSVALFAIDPSSQTSGGAFLGDRVRMGDHSKDAGVYIRSMASRGALGGVARATRGAVRLATAAGFDFVFVETVGIGQSESDILSLADTTVLVLLPHSGDEIQLMKAGVLEHCNIYVVNKADLHDTTHMTSELSENTHDTNSAWLPRVLATSAKNDLGIAELANAIVEHSKFAATQISNDHTRQEIYDEARYLFEESLKRCSLALDAKAVLEVERGDISVSQRARELIRSAQKELP